MSENNEIILNLKDINKSYGSTKVLENINLAVKNNEFFTILGSSGSGKSTIIRMIGGFTNPSSGEIIFENKIINDEPIFKRPFNTVFQDYALFPNMNVFNNVGFGLKIKSIDKNTIKEKVLEVLSIVGLESLSNRMPQELSGGQQQRVAIARALAMDPIAMLFDEPTSALDPEMINEVLDVMVELAKDGMTMMVVTHEMGFARRVAKRIIFMDEGRIEEDCSTDEFFDSQRGVRAETFLSKILHH